jgi:hypothetical protein
VVDILKRLRIGNQQSVLLLEMNQLFRIEEWASESHAKRAFESDYIAIGFLPLKIYLLRVKLSVTRGSEVNSLVLPDSVKTGGGSLYDVFYNPTPFDHQIMGHTQNEGLWFGSRNISYRYSSTPTINLQVKKYQS